MRQSGWAWTAGAGITGFVASFLFADVLGLPRRTFVLAWAVAGAAFVAVFAARTSVRLGRQFARRWLAGTIGGAIVGLWLVRQVLAQPPSSRPAGPALVAALAWYGAAYGAIDALLLSVVPVLALYGSRPPGDLQHPGSRVQWGLAALLGSALVTAAYHAGFAEFRGPQLVQPLIGNTVMTLAYLVTGSPVAPVLAHVLMHGGAVLHGMEATVQLPPH